MRRPVCAGLVWLHWVECACVWGLAGKQPGRGECVHGVCCRVYEGRGRAAMGVEVYCTLLHMHVLNCIAGAGSAGIFFCHHTYQLTPFPALGCVQYAR